MAERTTERTWRERGGLAVAVLVLVGVPLALIGGIASCVASDTGNLPGDSMERVWDTPYDKTAAEYGNAAWSVGDTVVRSRFDAVTAFDAGTGERRWEYVVPGRVEICATSAATDSVALIGLMETQGDKGCATVAAIDLKNGRELWRTSRLPGVTDPKYADDDLATGAGLAVVRDEDEQWAHEPDRRTRPVVPADQAVRAFDLRTGAPRWKAAVPKGCLPHAVAVTSRQVLVPLACATEAKLAAFDPADGKVRWTVPLGARRPVAPDAFMSFLSAEPTVLRVQERAPHGVNAHFAFDQEGRLQGEFDLGGGDRIVTDGKVIDGSGGGVTAYDLVTGKEVWSTEPLGAWREVTAMHVGRGRVTVFTHSRKGLAELHVYDSATGETVDERTFDEDTDPGAAEINGLFRYEDLWIVTRWGEGAERPFSAYRTW
ncbi:PQQ-binding-like beta-propeller repeat protein [Streptomyces sp. NPDC012769]|uniref:outer membrane protein assembly factor BamB family protein n=1 Tax=Streptomyces sp. NPDC012769 TaxID=3364848 RepID=UPI0036B93BC7